MAAKCQQCQAKTQLFLCNTCTNDLTNMLGKLPWLLDELDARIQCLDRINVGTIGRRRRRPDEMAAIDFDAVETAREIRTKLLKWVTTVAEQHTGRRPPGLHTVTTKNLGRWLQANTHAIAQLDCAADIYRGIKKIVGQPEQGGQLITAINPPANLKFVGPCPAFDNSGKQCLHELRVKPEKKHVKCPKCGITHQVKHVTEECLKRSRHLLLTLPRIEELLEMIDEPVSGRTLRRWRQDGHLKPRGYWRPDGHRGTVRRTKEDVPGFWLEDARKLRAESVKLGRSE